MHIMQWYWAIQMTRLIISSLRDFFKIGLDLTMEELIPIVMKVGGDKPEMHGSA